MFARCVGEWNGFAVAMDDLIDGDDRVVALGRYNGTYKNTGRAMNPQAVHVWSLKDGKVVRFQQFIDTLDAAGAFILRAIRAGSHSAALRRRSAASPSNLVRAAGLEPAQAFRPYGF